MVMIEFTLLVSSSDLTFHHGRQGKRPTITPSKLSGLAEDVKHNWLITIKKSLHRDPDKPPHSHCYSSIREYDNQRGPSERFVQRYKEQVYKGVRIKDIPLNVHQGTVVESAGELATALYEQEGITEDVKQELQASVRHLDGTDACVFFTVKNVDILSNPSFLDDTTNLKEQVENAIQTLPAEINNYREINTLTWMRLYNSSKKGI